MTFSGASLALELLITESSPCVSTDVEDTPITVFALRPEPIPSEALWLDTLGVD